MAPQPGCGTGSWFGIDLSQSVELKFYSYVRHLHKPEVSSTDTLTMHHRDAVYHVAPYLWSSPRTIPNIIQPTWASESRPWLTHSPLQLVKRRINTPAVHPSLNISAQRLTSEFYVSSYSSTTLTSLPLSYLSIQHDVLAQQGRYLRALRARCRRQRHPR